MQTLPITEQGEAISEVCVRHPSVQQSGPASAVDAIHARRGGGSLLVLRSPCDRTVGLGGYLGLFRRQGVRLAAVLSRSLGIEVVIHRQDFGSVELGSLMLKFSSCPRSRLARYFAYCRITGQTL